MNRTGRFSALTILFVGLSLLAGSVTKRIDAQERLDDGDEPRSPRVLAPGVLKVVSPLVEEHEVFTQFRPLVNLNTVPFEPKTAPTTDTLFTRAQNIIYRHDVWCLEFAFKPLRMIEVEIPQPTGKMQKRIVWYLVYRVRNLGDQAALGNQEVRDESGNATFDVVNKSNLEQDALFGRFFPTFALQGWTEEFGTQVNENGETVYAEKEYLDRVIPSAVDAIRKAEDAAIPLLNSVEISQIDIPVSTDTESHAIWGVATWEMVDPRIDYASVFVQGLTNAYRVNEQAEADEQYEFKTLQINFWRPGDTLEETVDTIRYGIPLVDALDEQIEIAQLYELPGPVVEVIEFDANNDRSTLLFTVDGDINDEYDSRAQQILLGGQIPAGVLKAFQEFGLEIDQDTAIQEKIRNRQWEFSVDIDGKTRNFRLRFTPLYWEKIGDQLHFTDRVEYLWIYR